MTEEVENKTIKVPEDCSIAAYGHMIFHLKKGENEVPENHIDAVKTAIKESGIFNKTK